MENNLAILYEEGLEIFTISVNKLVRISVQGNINVRFINIDNKESDIECDHIEFINPNK